ncbi:hypothetical protein DV737_g1242, partial [Chaetothyriales sp. CBS 132003]
MPQGHGNDFSGIELGALPHRAVDDMPTPSASPRFLTSISRFISRTYVLDWLCVSLLKASSYFLRFVIPPVHQQFLVSDLRISHPFADPERVTSLENYIYCAVVPTALILLWGFVFRPGFHQAHVTILGILVSITLAGFLTAVIKNAIGRPRPDLITRCIVRLGTSADKLVGIEVCTNEDKDVLNDGWRSFPSGHSSLAFSGLGYFALFLSGQLRTFRPRPDLARVLVSFAPLVGAMLVAMGRMADYRHDKYDVTVGSLIGIGFAFFSYKRYYKPLRSAQCHEVWPSLAAENVDYRSSKQRRVKDLEEHSLDDVLDGDLEDLIDDDERGDARLLGTEEGGDPATAGRAEQTDRHGEDR